MGKPVLCYIREEDAKFVPQKMIEEMPIKKIRPDHLVEDIGRVLEKRNEWVDWGIASRMYVERWHNPETLSRALIDAYNAPQKIWDLPQYI